jgi:hypothetical protein
MLAQQLFGQRESPCARQGELVRVFAMLQSTMLPPTNLEVRLPPGWVERPNPEGLREFWAGAHGTTGILQVSEFPPEELSFIAEQEDLGAFAETLGTRLGMGNPGIARQGTCKLGRFGAAVFTGGQFPATVLWVTVSARAALMWTWLGPDPAAEEVKQAFPVVLEARHADSRGEA